MKDKTILKPHFKRSWDLPVQQWQYYQEWNDVLFLHFEVPYEELRKLVPKELILDDFDQRYFVSIVCFKMEKIRPRNLPSVSFISDFHEINVRTYIKNNKKAGVYFLSIEASSLISVKIAKLLSGLPYEKSNLKRTVNSYINTNNSTSNSLKISFNVKNPITKDSIKDWLTERYCLYLIQNQEIYRYEIQHQEWQLNAVDLVSVDLNYTIENLEFTKENLASFQYSKGVTVVSWPKEKLTITT